MICLNHHQQYSDQILNAVLDSAGGKVTTQLFTVIHAGNGVSNCLMNLLAEDLHEASVFQRKN